MEEYVKIVKLKPSMDESALNEIKKAIDGLAKNDSIKEKLKFTDDLVKMEARIAELKKESNKADLKELDSLSKKSEYMKQILGLRDETKRPSLLDGLKSRIGPYLMSIANSFLSSLKSTLNASWEELNNMLSYSLLSNREIRDVRMTYGLSSAQAYGLSKAQEMVGISDMDDLFYMQSTEREKFFEIMTKYSQKYSELYDKGFFDSLLTYNIEMAELKQDLQMDVITFFVSNKDLIKSALTFEMNALSFIMNAVADIANWFGLDTAGAQTAKAGDVMNSYSSKSIAVKMDNTYNVTGEVNQSNLVDAGEQTYAALIKVLKEF